MAAEDVFSEMGLRAQIEEVARRAGVGVGTVCRHFPTKEALVEAVLAAMYGSLLQDARRALEQPDPGAAFQTFFYALSEFQARHRALAEHMAAEIDLPVSAQSVRDDLRRAIGELVARAQDAGEPAPRATARLRTVAEDQKVEALMTTTTAAPTLTPAHIPDPLGDVYGHRRVFVIGAAPSRSNRSTRTPRSYASPVRYWAS